MRNVSDDIATRLREWQAEFAGTANEAIYKEAADEIERLRKALRMACEELCKDWPHLYYSTPEVLISRFSAGKTTAQMFEELEEEELRQAEAGHGPS